MSNRENIEKNSMGSAIEPQSMNEQWSSRKLYFQVQSEGYTSQCWYQLVLLFVVSNQKIIIPTLYIEQYVDQISSQSYTISCQSLFNQSANYNENTRCIKTTDYDASVNKQFPKTSIIEYESTMSRGIQWNDGGRECAAVRGSSPGGQRSDTVCTWRVGITAATCVRVRPWIRIMCSRRLLTVL